MSAIIILPGHRIHDLTKQELERLSKGDLIYSSPVHCIETLPHNPSEHHTLLQINFKNQGCDRKDRPANLNMYVLWPSDDRLGFVPSITSLQLVPHIQLHWKGEALEIVLYPHSKAGPPLTEHHEREGT